MGIEVYSIHVETQNLHAELYNRHYKQTARLFRTENARYAVVMTSARAEHMRMAQTLLKELVAEVLATRGPTESHFDRLNGIFEEKSEGEAEPQGRGDSEEDSDDFEDLSDVSDNANSKIQNSINFLVQNIFKKRAEQDNDSAGGDSLRHLTRPKREEDSRELSRASDGSRNDSLSKTNKPSEFSSAEETSDKTLVERTALKNVALTKSGSSGRDEPVQSSKTVNLNRKTRNKKKKIGRPRASRPFREDDYVPLFVSTAATDDRPSAHSQSNFFRELSQSSSRDSDLHSFTSQNSEKDRELLDQIDRELAHFESNKEQHRRDFQQDLAHMLGTKGGDEWAAKRGRGSGSVSDDEHGRTMKGNGDRPKTGGDDENELDVTQSTQKISDMTHNSYSLRHIENMYNELMHKANNVPSTNSWKLPSRTTDPGSIAGQARSDLSSLRQCQGQK